MQNTYFTYLHIDRNTNLYFSSFIHGIQLFHEFNSSSVPIKMLKIRIKKYIFAL